MDMAVEIVKTKLHVPAFSYRGNPVSAMELNTVLYDNLNTGKPAYELAHFSAELSDKVGLYLAGRDISLNGICLAPKATC